MALKIEVSDDGRGERTFRISNGISAVCCWEDEFVRELDKVGLGKAAGARELSKFQERHGVFTSHPEGEAPTPDKDR